MANNKNWKANELLMFNTIKTKTKLTDLTKCQYEYAHYDCYTASCNIELKYRTDTYGPSNYDTTVIERAKYNALMNSPKVPIYAVAVEGKIYLFNLRQLTDNDYEFNWGPQPGFNKTTHFNNRSKTTKNVGYISWDMADKVIPIKENSND